MKTIVLTVDGMSCAHCVHAVQTALKALSGVSDASVSLADKTAAVTYDPAAVSPEALKAAIEDQGFEVLS